MKSLKLKATGKLTTRLDITKGSISEQVDIYEGISPVYSQRDKEMENRKLKDR